jgi:hypothetical protein
MRTTATPSSTPAAPPPGGQATPTVDTVPAKRCSACHATKPLGQFDIDRHRSGGRSSQCKTCRQRRQASGGYDLCRKRALAMLARLYPGQYRRCLEVARRQLAPGSAPRPVWTRAHAKALRELARRHRADRNGRTPWRLKAAFRAEYVQLLAGYAGARPASPALNQRIARHARRQLQLAHPVEFHLLYAAERARVGNPIDRLVPPAPPRIAARQVGPALPASDGQQL